MPTPDPARQDHVQAIDDPSRVRGGRCRHETRNASPELPIGDAANRTGKSSIPTFAPERSPSTLPVSDIDKPSDLRY